jgi:hypothetical protein
MAATYRSSTSTNTGAATAASVVVTVPSGVQVNDVLLAAVAVDGGTGATITAPSGWTVLQNPTQSTNTRLTLYFRMATGYETSTYTWSFDTARFASALMVAYSGAHIFIPPALANINTSSASTTITGTAVNSSYEGGRGLQIYATRNTTGVTSLTAANGYIKREETSTSATTFIGLELQDVGKTLPMGGLPASNAASTQSATGQCISAFIEDARPAFAIVAEDEFSCGSQTGSFTTTNAGSIQTNYPNTLLLAFVMVNKDSATVSSISGGTSTWTLVSRSNTNAGSCEVWRAFVAVPSAQTFTYNFSGAIVSGNHLMCSITGADFTSQNGASAIGNVVTGSTTAAAPSIDLTTTRDNSWVWAAASEGTASAATITAGSNQTLLRSHNDTGNACASFMWRQNATTPTSGTVVTMNCTQPTNTNCNIVAIEILPAIRKNFASLGIG